MSSRLFSAFRIALALGAIASLMLASWWTTPVFMTLLALRWRAWEVPLIGVFADFLWLPAGGFSALPLFTCFGIAIVWIFEPLRARFLLP